MNKQNIHNLSKYALYAVPFLPFIFIEGFFYPFIITKTLFFRLLIEISFTGYLWLLITDYQNYRPRLNTAQKLVAFFTAINIMAAIFGLDVYRSFFSDFERMEGVLLVVYLAIYLFLLGQFLRTEKDWLKYIKIIVSVSFLVAVYGVVQKFNILPVFEAGTNRVSATIGNAAFLAGYMLLTAGLAFYWLIVEDNKYWKYFAMVALVLNSYVLFLTATRGALLGFIFGIGLYLLINALYRHGLARQLALFCIVAAIAFSLAFVYLRDNFKNSTIESVRRIANISLQDVTVKNRLTAWSLGWRSFTNHPFLGVGLENFNYEYNKYFTPDINESWFDRTHNIYLDQLVQNGILGLILYLTILFYLFYRLFSLRKNNFLIFAVFTPMLVAYSIHNFFVFDALSTAFLYFFIIAFIAVAGESQDEIKVDEKPISFGWQTGLLLLGNVFILYYFIWLPFYINRNIYIGYYYAVADTSRSYEAFQTVQGYKLAGVQAASQLNSVYEVLTSRDDSRAVDKQNFLQLTEKILRQSVAQYPLEVRNRLYLAQLLINEATSTDEINEAREIILRAQELSPTRPEIYYLLFNVYLHQENIDQAQAVLEDLIAKVPWFGEPKILLANALKKIDEPKARALFAEGINQSYPHSPENNKRILEYLLYFKEYEQAIPYYKVLIEQEPQNYDLRVDLSKLYYLNKDFDRAVEEINFINAHNPEALKGNEDYLLQLQNAF